MGKKRRTNASITWHHRLPKAQGGTLEEDNISPVEFGKHCSYNHLFDGGNMSPEQMAKILTDVWIRPDYVMLAIPRCKPCLRCAVCEMEAQNGGTFL